MEKKYYFFFIVFFFVFLSNERLNAQSPGGVNANLKLWLKANSGITTNGSNVSAWADQSGGGFNATQGTVAKQPTFTPISTIFNGNPSVNFDIIDDGMATTASIAVRPYSFFVVYNSTSSSTASRRAIQGAPNNWLIGPWRNVACFYADVFVDPRNLGIGSKPTINTALSTSSATNNASFYFDGKMVSAAGGVTAPGVPNTIHLAGSGGNPAETLEGSIAEVIAYTNSVSAVEKNKIESYLAIKYGVTLDQTAPVNYVNSSNTILYPSATTHTGFSKDVVVVTRDDGSGLNQTSSKSSNPGALLSVQSLAMSNGDYFASGDNGLALNLRSTDAPVGYGNRLQRVWRVSKSANPSTVTIRMFVGDIPELMFNPDLAAVALLKNSTNSFASVVPITGGTIVGAFNDTIEFTGVSLNDGDYFTLSLGTWTAPAYDFEFWYGVPEWSSSGTSPQKIHLTGVSDSEYAQYRIDMPADLSFVPITGMISPLSSSIIDITSLITAVTVTPANQILNKGIRIQVLGKMGAYYANENAGSFATFPLRGPNAMGTSFIVPGQDRYPNYNGSDGYAGSKALFVITAIQDGTTVTITPSEAITGHGANVPFTVILNKGQSYSARAISSTGIHLAGSLVISSLPVVITYADGHIQNGPPTTAADNAGDQLVPIVRLANEYVQIRTNLSPTTDERIFVFGTENGTTVTVFDGTTTTTLVVNSGSFVTYNLPTGINAASIKADKSIMVYQIGGFGGEFGSAILTPIADCKGADFIAFQYPSVANNVYFNFVAADAVVGGFVLNGNSTLVQASDFISIPGVPGWKYCRKNMTNIFPNGSVIAIDNTLGKFSFYQNALSPGGGDYSNFSDFGNVVLFPKANHTCSSNDITLNSGAIAYNVSISSYRWTGPNGFTSTLANPVISNPTVANAGTYVLSVTDDNGCPYTENLTVDLPISSITVTPTPSTPCVGSTLQFTSATVPAGTVPASIRWTGPNGFTSSQASFEITSVSVSNTGTYTCTYTDKYGCAVSASTSVTVSPSVVSSFTIAGNSRLSCISPSTTLNVTGFAPGLNYETFQPYNALSLFSSSDFTVITNGFYNEQPANSGVATQMNLGGLAGIAGSSVSYGTKYSGFINITAAGSYTFYTNSIDGSNLYVDGSLSVSNDGSHGATEIASAAIFLSAGYHNIEVNYFKSAIGTSNLSVSYAGPSIAKQAIPASVLFHAAGAAPALTYTWSNGAINTTSITVSTPGVYTVTGSNGGCNSATSFTVTDIDSYDYSDIAAPWPVAQAKVTSCIIGGVPSGSNGAVWAGSNISIEPIPLRNATASADNFDDGLISPTNSGGPFNVILTSNTPGTEIHYGLWFDWNNNGNFADDVDGNGNPAFYNGSGTAGASGSITIAVSVFPPANANTLFKTRLIAASIPVVFTAYDDIFENGEVEDYIAVPSLGGTVLDDANGLNGIPVNTVDGTGINIGGTLTAILVNSTGNVVANATVASNGVYNFTAVTPATYSIVLSTSSGTIGSAAPSAGLPAGWVNTGENLGLTAGNDGTVNGVLSNVIVSAVNVVNANFGVNSIPIANDVTSCEVDSGGSTEVNVPILTGSDVEAGTYNGSGSTDKITILTLPANGILYYNGAFVTAGQVISNYNPNILKLDPDAGADIVSFTYNEIDLAGTISLPGTATIKIAYAGIDQSALLFGSATMAAVGTGVWTAQAGNPGTSTITTPSSSTTTITGFDILGTYNFIWTNSNGCMDIIKVNVPTASAIIANDDIGSSVNGVNGGISLTNVLSNDTLNGSEAIVATVNISFLRSTIPEITLSGTNVVVAPGAPSGNYTLEYQICEMANPTNCDNAVVTVNVTAAIIDAVIDNYTTVPVNGIIGGTTASVLSNDILNGVVLTPSDITLTGVTVPSGLTLNTDGTITVIPGTSAGTYIVTYRICENLNATNCDTTTATVFVMVPEIALVKTASVGGTGAVGDLITYTFNVTNTGNVSLSSVVVNDARTGSVNLATSPAILAPGDTGTATGTYSILQSDINTGSVTNTATATGTAPDASTVSDTSGTAQGNDDPTQTPLAQAPGIALVKTALVGGTGAVGDLITYTFNVTNTGNVSLSSVVVNDARTGSVNLATSPAILAPGDTGTATGTYSILQSDINTGSVTNTATATGTAPDASTVSDTSGTAQGNDDPTQTPLAQAPGIALVKTALVGGTGAVGDLITYTFNVTNTGNVSLSSVVVNDARTGSVNLATSPAILAPGDTGTATGTYSILQSDINTGSVTNTATATGTAPDASTVSDTSGTAQGNDDPTQTPLAQAPGIALVKTALVGGTGAVGDLITYTFNVTNTGNVSLSSVVVNDARTGSVNLATSPAILAPGDTGTATGTYSILQSDINTGSVTNTATATGTAPDASTVSDTSGTAQGNDDPTQTPLAQAPGIALVKTALVGGTGAVGDLITYTFNVTNTGNVSLSSVVVNDARTGSVNLATSPAILAPGDTGTATATYSILQSDINTGSVTNTATATGTAPDASTVSDASGTAQGNDDPTQTPLAQAPGIALVKTASVGGTGAVGDLITYTFNVTNTGNVSLSSVVVNDARTGSVNLATSPAILAPGDTGTATATYSILQSDINTGSVTNTATATGTAPDASTVSDASGTAQGNDDPTQTPLAQAPGIALVKTALVGGTGAVGDLITYTFNVTNTGNVSLSSVVVNDARTGSVNLATSPAILAPGDTGTATGTYSILQSDINTGSVTNTATATGTAPDASTVSDTSGTAQGNDDPTQTPLAQAPGIALVKTALVGGTGAVGDLITYTFNVTNTGNVSLSSVVVNDARTGSVNLATSPAILAPGDTGTATGTYSILQSDINTGSVTNTATATGTAPDASTVSDTSGTAQGNDDPTQTPLAQAPGIALVKTALVGGTGAVGDLITYTFNVTNTGNVSLSSVVVNDARTGSVNLATSPAILAPGDTGTATATYSILQSDINTGSVTNTATATGTAPDASTVSDASGTAQGNDDPTQTPLAQAPGIALVKTASVGGTGAVGDLITYTFNVTNTGNVSLSSVVVNDARTGSVNLATSPAILAPGDTGTATATYSILQSDINTGSVTNTATATGTAPDASTVSDTSGTAQGNDDPTQTPLAQAPGIALVKTALVGGTGAVGDLITYTFNVTNTGNVSLSSVVVNDARTGSVNLATSPAILAPGDTGTATGTYSILQSDINTGSVTNTATATGTAPDASTVSDTSGTAQGNDDPTQTPLAQAPGIALVKTALVGGTGAVGDLITYTFNVTNTGNVSLSSVVVNDARTGSVNLATSPAILAPGDTGTATATYSILQSDINTGSVTNTATATGTAPDASTVSDASGTAQGNDDPTQTPLAQAPGIALVKTASVGGTGAVGDLITYTFNVTNTGNVSLSSVVVNDARTGSVNLATSPAILAPGDTGTATATYSILQSDINTGSVTNTATATGTAPDASTVSDTSGTAQGNDDPTQTPLAQAPGIALVKTALVGGTGAVGDLITYTFNVTNTGNVSLSSVVVNDARTGSVNLATSPAILAPGDTGTATGTYSILQSDINTGSVTNTATATGTAPDASTVSDTSGTAQGNDDPTQTPLAQAPGIALVKTALVGGTGAVGDLITYTFNVTNTGNVSLSSVVVNDARTGSVNLATSPAILAPGDTGTATGTYSILQSDINTGSVTNTATATGTAPDASTVSDASGTAQGNDDPTQTPLAQAPGIALVKTASVGGTGAVGDLITYTFNVTNTGNVSLSSVVVNDARTGSVNLATSPAILAPGDTGTATGTYSILQSDINTGSVTNTATATGTAPDASTVSDTSGTAQGNDDPTQTPLAQAPGIALVKTALVGGTGAVGDLITYTFNVTNTGNVSLSSVVVNDARTGSVNLATSPAILAPGDTGTATGTYSILQSDINTGSVTNTATATGTAPDASTVSDTSGTAQGNDDPTQTPLAQAPGIALVKTALVGGTGAVGDLITYTFNVTNTGNVSLSSVVVNDARTGSVNLATSPAILAPGDTGTATGTYSILQSDINTGSVTNTATATGTAPDASTVSDTSGTAQGNDDPTQTPLAQAPGIALVKTALVGGTGAVGDLITYTFNVTNTGNVSLSSVVVNDARTGSVNLATSPAILAPGDTGTATGTYSILQSDINTGSVTNTATATGTAPDASTVSDTSGTAQGNDDPTQTPLAQAPGIALVKTSTFNDTNSDGFAQVGETITYNFIITNTGNVSLNNIIVRDPLVNITGAPIVLAPGAVNSTIFKAIYIIVQADIDNGSVTNQATVSATVPTGSLITKMSDSDDPLLGGPDDPTLTILNPQPVLKLWKEGTYQDANHDGEINIGDNIQYTFTVQNTGTVTIKDIMITDLIAAVTGGPLSSLAPGAIDNTTFTALYSLTQLDFNTGAVYNSAMANGQTAQGIAVGANSKDPSPIGVDDPNYDPTCPDCTVVSIRLKSGIAIVKHAVFNDNNADGIAQSGETITYSFTIINTGDTTLRDITVTDPLPGLIMSGEPILLLPGEQDTSTFRGIYTIGQLDINIGTVVNQATVSGRDALNVVVSDLSDAVDENGNDATVIVLNGCTIKVFNALSVNGDGQNDTFYIGGIECYPDNTVTIYNRWGVQVYHTKGYNNKDRVFKGYSDGRATIASDNKLPAGTYFYVLEYTKNDDSLYKKSGYMNLN
jgi:gliding motility-associated-like protein/uncharacterized repeat protein (TIGR01451 family)